MADELFADKEPSPEVQKQAAAMGLDWGKIDWTKVILIIRTLLELIKATSEPAQPAFQTHLEQTLAAAEAAKAAAQCEDKG